MPKDPGPVLIPCEGTYDSPLFTLHIESLPPPKTIPQSSTEFWVDHGKITFPLTLRARRQGEEFKPCGGKTKGLKKYMIEKKIPAAFRDLPLILESEGCAFLILGQAIHDAFKLTPNTTRALKITVQKKK